MASPWKFLASLVSPRRQQKQENDPNEDVNTDGLAIAGSTEKPPQFDRSAAREPSEEAGRDGTLDTGNSEVVKDSGGSHAYEPPKAKAALARRRRRATQVDAPVAALQNSPVAGTIPDEISRLDGEIRILRGNLASKLRLQNAQLMKMLQRFES